MDRSFQYLKTPPESKIEPPIEGTINVLPLEKLAWKDFERLCLRMVEVEHSIEDSEIYGIHGQKQEGIDIFAKTENGKYSNFQCKRYQTINESTLKGAISAFKKGKWFSKSEKFTFCTTASLNSTQLQIVFNELKDELKKTDIELIKWDKSQICRILKTNPRIVTDFFGKEWSIRFNGLTNYPQESIMIRNGNGSSNNLISISDFLEYNPESFLDYNDYLKQNKLQYYSRGQYVNESKKSDINFVTENRIINDLISDEYIACIISGEGGIGKTRLMYEVAKRVSRKHKYQAYRVENNIKSVDEIFSLLNDRTKYLFVFDYIEENELFDQFIDKAKQNIFHVKILGNCRNTHQWSQRYFISEHYLNNENSFEIKYQRKVTQKIMQPIWTNFLNKNNKKFYKTKPSFAVFLRFLFDKNLTENDITNFPDFETWLIRRFSLSLKDKYIEKDCINSILLLPIVEYKTKEHNEISIRSFKRKHPYITKLIKDGWLQISENIVGTKRLDTVHDTIKDELFLHILKECKKKSILIDKLIETIEFAQIEKLEMNWFRSLERISDSAILKAHRNFYIEFFNEALREQDLLTDSSIFHITKTSLLTEIQRFECITKNHVLFHKFTDNPSFGLSLQNAMNYFSKALKNDNLQAPEVLKKLSEEWLRKNDNFTEFGYLADRFISTYINLYSINELIQPHVFQFISKKYTEFGGFTLCSWLENGGDLVTVESYLIDFLEENEQNMDAQFVLTKWLNNGGDKTTIEKHLLKYLNYFAKENGSKYVLEAWLRQGGNLTTIKRYIIEFLNQNIEENENQYLLVAWINSGEERNILKRFMIKYLNKWINESEVSFVIKAWLDNGGDKTIIESYLIEYMILNTGKKGSEVGFVIKAWLDNGGDKTIIESYLIDYLILNTGKKGSGVDFVIKAWLENGGNEKVVEKYLVDFLKHNVVEKETSFVFKAWLDHGGSTTIIESQMIDFLEINTKIKDTGVDFVIKAWLESGGNKNKVERFLTEYLEQNAKEKDSEVDFVIKAWLESGGDKTTIEYHLVEFLKQNSLKKETSFVIKSWLDQGGDKTVVTSYLIKFLEHNAKEKESSYVIRSWFEQGGDITIIENYLSKYLEHNVKEKESSYVIKAWIERGGDIKKIKGYIIEFLKSNITNNDIDVGFVIKSWLNNGGDKTVIERYIIDYLNQNTENHDSSYIIQSWIEHSDNIKVIENYLIRFLNKNVEEKDSSFIIQTWLEREGCKSIIKNFLIKFLERNAKEAGSSFVIQTWLEKGGDKKTVENYLIQYLTGNAKDRDSRFVISAWLNNGGDIAIIESYLIMFLTENSKTKDSQFVLSAWLKNKGDHNSVKKFVIEYLNRYAKMKDSSYVIQAWIKSGAETNSIIEHIYDYFNIHADKEYASFVIQPYLQYVDFNKERIKPYLKIWLDNYITNNNSKYLLYSWLKNTQDNNFIEVYIKKWLEEAPEEEFASKLIEQWIKNGGDYYKIIK